MLSIRPMTPTDVPTLATMLGSMEPWLSYGVDPTRWDRLLRTIPPEELAYVAAEAEGAPAGYVQFRLGGTFGLSGYVRTLAVDPARAGQGVGRSLLAHAERMILEHGPNVFLLCSSRNETAQRFYEAMGYEACGRLPAYVLATEDEIIYRKTIGPVRR